MFITVQELCDQLKVKKSTIYSWIGQGLIPHYKICGGPIRFKHDEINLWVEQFKKTSVGKKDFAKGYPIKNSNIDDLIRRAIDETRCDKL